MKTAYCPLYHTELANVTAGREFGHTPGHKYHDVDVVISYRDFTTRRSYRCHVVESWGSAQGYDEEHGRNEVVSHGSTVAEAVALAQGQAAEIEMSCEYTVRALRRAVIQAVQNPVNPQWINA